jgi:hypothetical protein
MQIFYRLMCSPLVVLVMFINTLCHWLVWLFDNTYDHDAAVKTYGSNLDGIRGFHKQ